MLAISRVSVASTSMREDVLLEGDLVAAVHLPVVEHPVVAEQLHRLLGDQLGQRVERGLQVRQAALGRLGLPVVGVAVAVEDDGAVVGDDLLEHLLHGGVELGAAGDSVSSSVAM